MVSCQGMLYSWGPNEMGQLGHGDFKPRETPSHIKTLNDKQITCIGLGDDFVVALGKTFPFSEIERRRKEKIFPKPKTKAKSNSSEKGTKLKINRL